MSTITILAEQAGGDVATAGSTILILSALKLVTVLLGFVIVALAWRAFRSTGRKPFMWLAIGLGLMTIGAIAEGAAFQGLDLSLDESHVIEAVFTLAAFGVLVYSLFARDTPRTESHPVEPTGESAPPSRSATEE